MCRMMSGKLFLVVVLLAVISYTQAANIPEGRQKLFKYY
jgi:hypothetical protein